VEEEVTPQHNEIAYYKKRILECQHAMQVCMHNQEESNTEYKRLYGKWEVADKVKEDFYREISNLHREVSTLEKAVEDKMSEMQVLQPAIATIDS
jgi:chromosome segregation ATPase